MATGWQPVEGGFAFHAGGFTGRLRTSRGAVSTLEFAAPVPAKLGWTRIDWKDEQGRERDAQTASDAAYVQEPYVVVPATIANDVGLHLTAFVRTSDAGTDLDLRLTTTEPLARVGLQAFLAAPAGVTVEGMSDALKAVHSPAVSAGVGLERISVDGSALAMFVDVGECGARVRLADRINYTFYSQPLEKGVILVGRMAWRPWTSDAQVAALMNEWLDRPSASL